MGSLKIMDHTGHSTLVYAESDLKEVEHARQLYRQKVATGYTPMVKLEDGTFARANPNTFNATSDYVLVTPIAGG